MTDNHSTDQNNNSDEKIDSYENEITESMHNGKKERKMKDSNRIGDFFSAYDTLQDAASSASNGVKKT